MKKKLTITPGEIYLIRKRKKPYIAIISIDTEILTTERQQALEELKKYFDLFFIFNPRENWPVRKINASRFTSLQEGIGFVINEEKGTGISFINAGECLSETVEGIVAISYSPISSLGNLSPEDIEKIGKNFITLSTSAVHSPVLNITRRELKDMEEEWKEEVIEEEEPISLQPIDYFTGAYIESKSHREGDKHEYLGFGSWKTHTSETILPFFRPRWFKEFIEKTKEQEGWYESWLWEQDPRNIIASGIKFFDDLLVLDRDPIDLDINPPMEEKSTKRRKKNAQQNVDTEGI